MNSYLQRKINQTCQLIYQQRFKKLARARVFNTTKESPEHLAILFICSGNICRSAFAEFYLRRRLEQQPLKTKINISSAGTYTNDNLCADPFAIKHALDFNINLNPHKTKRLNKELIKAHDIILAMEPSHILQTMLLDLGSYTKTYLLSSFDDRPESIIIDPYNKSKDVFKDTFLRIITCLDNFLVYLDKENLKTVSSSV